LNKLEYILLLVSWRVSKEYEEKKLLNIKSGHADAKILFGYGNPTHGIPEEELTDHHAHTTCHSIILHAD